MPFASRGLLPWLENPLLFHLFASILHRGGMHLAEELSVRLIVLARIKDGRQKSSQEEYGEKPPLLYLAGSLIRRYQR